MEAGKHGRELLSCPWLARLLARSAVPANRPHKTDRPLRTSALSLVHGVAHFQHGGSPAPSGPFSLITRRINLATIRQFLSPQAACIALEVVSRPSEISWIGALQLWGVLACSIVSGKAFDVGYMRHVVAFGSMIYVAG